MATAETKKTESNKKVTNRRRPRRKPAQKKAQPTKNETKIKTPKKEEEVKKVVTEIEEKVETQPEQHVDNIRVCENCHEHIEKNVTQCPNCNKDSKDHNVTVIICILAVLLLASLVFSHFYNKQEEGDDTPTAELISYEELMQNAGNLVGTNVKVMGTILDLDFNDRLIRVNSNVFPIDDTEYIIFAEYDLETDVTFTIGDMVIIYGYLRSVEHNIPFIQAKQVTLAD